ncbi:hypothetical protein H2201_001785 [Coniosporium apollinis]|uniref:Abscisic acid G-protein coupled receptor-like domain-containing protein n=2 Tax=Coniosporium TaxID=2810619 RepID=A0ABQ9P047_9PEZI|nr:hypothetical protein H2199_000419 [Cladosporium sp. JES 115]KAJ9667980.1 hypothetical protein H2201_001785 [Coniosporium apollinis]
MLPAADDCDDCVPDYLKRRELSTLAISSLPFLLTFLVVATAVLQKLFPLLSGSASPKDHHEHQLPTHFNFREASASAKKNLVSKPSAKRLAGFTFSTNIALSAVLVELILCEISNALNPAARSLALKVTLSSLLFLLILATPALELHSIISAAGWRFGNNGSSSRKRRFLSAAWALETVGLAVWLLAFWYIGSGLLGSYLHEPSYQRRHSFTEGCLERIGVIGISLMASLAGFAAVSSLWQTFGTKARLVSEADIARKQAGLEATTSMLEAKRSRMRALERKLSETPSEGFMTRVIGTIRGNADTQERQALQFEISGLETMRSALHNSLLSLRSRRTTQLRSRTAIGRCLNIFQYGFSIYCAYRIGTTSLALSRRLLFSPNQSLASSDPVNNVLALLAKHWDPTLDRAAWSRQVSFLLSGVMLLASFNSVLQTCLLFARFVPGVMAHAQANLALIVSQVAGTYVISSALLLRSNLPKEVSSVISEALGAPLEPVFVERWFEGWFLVASALTAVGIWIGRRVGSGDWDEDDEFGGTDVEMGKMS